MRGTGTFRTLPTEISKHSFFLTGPWIWTLRSGSGDCGPCLKHRQIGAKQNSLISVHPHTRGDNHNLGVGIDVKLRFTPTRVATLCTQVTFAVGNVITYQLLPESRYPYAMASLTVLYRVMIALSQWAANYCRRISGRPADCAVIRQPINGVVEGNHGLSGHKATIDHSSAHRVQNSLISVHPHTRGDKGPCTLDASSGAGIQTNRPAATGSDRRGGESGRTLDRRTRWRRSHPPSRTPRNGPAGELGADGLAGSGQLPAWRWWRRPGGSSPGDDRAITKGGQVAGRRILVPWLYALPHQADGIGIHLHKPVVAVREKTLYPQAYTGESFVHIERYAAPDRYVNTVRHAEHPFSMIVTETWPLGRWGWTGCLDIFLYDSAP